MSSAKFAKVSTKENLDKDDLFDEVDVNQTNIEMETEPYDDSINNNNNNNNNDNKISNKDSKNNNKTKEDENVPNLGGLKRLKKEFSHGLAIYAIIGAFAAFCNGGVMPVFAVVFSEIVDILSESVDSDGNSHFQRDSLYALFMFVGMGTGALVFNIMQYLMWGIYGAQLSTRVRQTYFESLTRQEIGFHEIETSSKINARLTTECFAIQEAVGTKYGFLIQTISQFIIGIALAFYYSWQLTLVLFATMPVLMVIGAVNGILMTGAGGKDADPYVNAGSFSQEVLTNIRTVIAFPALIKSKLIEYANLVALAQPLAIKKFVYIGIGLGAFMGGMFAVCYSVGLFTGSVFINDGTISVAEMFGAYFAYMMGGIGLGQLGSIASDLKAGELAANKFYNVYLRNPKIKTVKSPIKININDKIESSIEFNNVKFAYPSAPQNMTLKGVNISIEAGKTLAIVGPSGSGKSTIIGLLERYYDPIEGEIKVGGQLIHNYDISSLRNHIGLVSQMPLLFDANIKENIRGGNTDATDEEIEKAAKLANAHEFILNLSKGYDTPVGELGGRLSGGQRQRICIARAILKMPSILLLDEATSALDTKSEKEVQDALDQVTKNLKLTTVVIAHRLSTIKDADKIMVLVNGTVEEVGTHEDLIHQNGVYSALVASQQLIESSKEHHQLHKKVSRRNSDSIITGGN